MHLESIPNLNQIVKDLQNAPDEARKGMYTKAFETMVDRVLASNYAEELCKAIDAGHHTKQKAHDVVFLQNWVLDRLANLPLP